MLNTFIEVDVLSFKIPKISFFTYFFDIYIVCVIIEILPKRIRNFVRLFVLIFAYSLTVINVFCVYYFHAKIGPEILNVILETNQRESSEFFDKYINLHLLSTPIMLVLLLILVHIVCCYANRKNKKCMPSSLVYILFTVLFICTGISIKSRINLIYMLNVKNIEELDKHISNHTLNTPYNNLAFAIKVRILANNDLDVLAKNQSKFTIDDCCHTSSNIIFIIGESYIKDHSQLYGYSLKTTPYQKAREEQEEMTVFSDVITPANLTSVVFKNTFSLHSIDQKDSWSSYPLFPVLFHRAGYHVTFMTNQFVKSIRQDAFNITGGLFLNDDRLSKLQFDCRNIESHRYDEDLLLDYDSLQTFNTQYNLIIFHLAGQHIDFFKRSPDVFKKFTTTDYANRTDLNDDEKQIVADYDNATLYNDYVVEKIIERFENQDAIVIYMPDHGEECYDELHRMGRLPSGNFSPEVLRQEYRIPFWIWCSKKYKELRPNIVDKIQKSKDKPFMTDDIPHLFLYLAGINCKYYNDSKNILSDKFNTRRERLVEGIADYDKITEH